VVARVSHLPENERHRQWALHCENAEPAQVPKQNPVREIGDVDTAPDELVGPPNPEHVAEQKKVPERHGKDERQRAERLPREPGEERTSHDHDGVDPGESKSRCV